MDKEIKIATVIPAYNDEKYILECIQSIYNQKLKHNVHNTVFVTLNNSTDKTGDILFEFYNSKDLFFRAEKQFNLVKSEQNIFQGTTPTRNFLLQKVFANEQGTSSHFDYIANQDADDVWIDTLKLQKQIDFLEENKEIDILGTQYVGRIKNSEEKDYIQLERRPIDHDGCVQWFLNGLNPIGNASVLYRRNLVYKIGMYEDLLPLTEDMWFWYKALLAGSQFANLEDDCLLYNISSNPNYSPTYPQCLKQLIELILKTKKK
jgi:glycosyltransferase involved in cell wall biosynthesis